MNGIDTLSVHGRRREYGNEDNEPFGRVAAQITI